MTSLPERIERLWAARGEPDAVRDPEAIAAVHEAIDLLDTGAERVAEVVDGEVVVHAWLKQAILLLFRQAHMATWELGPFEYATRSRSSPATRPRACGWCRARRPGGAASSSAV
jgi:2,3,4,5-tetrahydropyridine-2-carboxylate N-succinyltransferase